jgi:hypothetical protein
MRGTSAGWACILLSAALVRAADSPELRDIERKAPKEPAYASERPLYGLLVFGPKAQARLWMVLDRSKPDAGPYDILPEGSRYRSLATDIEVELVKSVEER